MSDPLTDAEQVLKQVTGRLGRLLFVLAGPSGVGKNTIIKRVLANHPDVMARVRTYTTREPRNPAEHQQYRFVTVEEFKRLAIEGKLMEADANNPLGHDVYKTKDCYSMPADIYEDIPPDKHVVIAEVDVVGAERLRQRYPGCITIFITAPPDVLLKRIRERRDDTINATDIRQRMKTAQEHIRASRKFHYFVYNLDGKLEEAVQEVERIIRAERMRVRQGFDLEALLPANAFDAILEETGPTNETA